jgi:hypothetical protein
VAPRGLLEQKRPRPQAVWLEVRPQGVADSPAVRWGERYDLPAPAWSLTARNWPTTPAGSPPPQVEMWWNCQEDVSSVLLPRPAGTAPEALAGRTFAIAGDEGQRGRIDTIEFVRQLTRPDPDAPERMTDCLVVRATFPKGNPVWVMPDNAQVGGHEHQIAAEAGQYKGVFYGITKESARRYLNGLHVYFLEQFKKAPTTLHATLTPQESPNPEQTRPNSVRLRGK